MPTIVFQGLQSCVEPQMVETRTLRLKLSTPNPEFGTWNNLQSLSNSPKIPQQIESPYVYPMTKTNFYSKLSNRSLELCTENLGCETGTNMIENTLFLLPSRESNGGEEREREKYKPRHCLNNKKHSNRTFPPPLTTRIGSNSLEVRPIREGGRLVIQVAEVPSSHGCFQTERSNGRLRLSLFRDREDYENDDFENESCGNEVEELENEVNCIKEGKDFQEIDEKEELEKDEDYVVKNEVFLNGDMEGNNKEFRGEMGIKKYQRATWCKEGGRCSKGLSNWEPLWVATS